MHNQRLIAFNNSIGDQAKIKKKFEAFKHALKYI